MIHTNHDPAAGILPFRVETEAAPGPTGYTHAAYAGSLAEFGTPRHLPRCDGWILERQIPGTPYRDAIGPYPLFSCRDWSRLSDDLEEIGSDLISLMIVPAPFDGYREDMLSRCFSRVTRFKSHYVADLTQPLGKIVKKSHKETISRALKKVDVSYCPEPHTRLSKWVELFDTLVARHKIRGIRAFSAAAFARQLTIPGMVMFEARTNGEAIGLDLWYEQNDVAYGHLVAFSELGYSLRASYATKYCMLNYFAGRVRWVDFGGGAGTNADGTDGLSIFKQGWSTGSVPVYLCCRIFNNAVYRELTDASRNGETNYFPAYRAGELL